jgi:gluconolactonase
VNTKLLLTITAILAGSVSAAGNAAEQPLLGGEHEAVVTAIPGVVSGDAKWQLAWAGFETADGIVGSPDGGLLFAQEQTNTVKKLDADGKVSVFVSDTHGTGSVSLDTKGRLFAVERTCTDPGLHNPNCAEPTKVALLLPERKTLADSFPDGKSLGRLNDLVTDGKGGAYFTTGTFTAGGAWYVDAAGKVVTIEDQNLRSNGIMLSPDGKTLYVTNNMVVIAFDIQPDGSGRNRRDFCSLQGDTGGDGMAVDSEGRLYVTANAGIHVCSAKGAHLGVIPMRRRAITLAFSGPDKKTLYVAGMGAVGPDGTAFETPEGVRNTSMTIYKIPMIAQGYQGRPK